MGKLKYLIIHCTATPEDREVDQYDIMKWHLGPYYDKDGTIVYKGKQYGSIQELPDERIGGIDIAQIRGRGWKRVGYSKLFPLHTQPVTLVEYDDDDIVDPYELTNGVRGLNSVSRHFCYVGGLDAATLKPKDTRTQMQFLTLQSAVIDEVRKYSDILVAGHNSFSTKACPCFDVADWCRLINIPEKNIYVEA